MKFILISLLVIFITRIYCLIPEYHPDQIALLILSAGSWNDPYEDNNIIGNIVKDINGSPLSINIKANGEPEEYASIVDIIPSLRNLEPDELSEKFSKIYKLAFSTFYSIFEIEGEDDIILDDYLIKKIINENDLINALINPSEDTNLLQDPKYKGSLYTSSNIDKDNSLKEFINALKSEDVSNIDINQFNKLPDDFIEKWNDDESLPKLYKAIGIQCAKIKDCINQFQDEDDQNIQDISFNIASYTNNDEKTYNYSFIIINDKLRDVYHAFTLESDKNDNFKLNKHDSTYNYAPYDYINNYYVINSENIKKRKENEIIIEKGIGLLAECGLIYEDDDATYNPEYYGYKFEEIDDEDKEKVNELDERLLQLYDLYQDDGTYNSNIIINIFNSYLVSVESVNDNDDTDSQNISFVKSKTQNDNILCSYTNDQLAHIEELALRFIEARKYYYADTENKISEIQALFQSMESDNFFKRDNSLPSDNHEEIDLLPYFEQYVINRFYEVIALKKTVKYDEGVFHNNDDSELINYNEYMITQNILSNMDTDVNNCIGQNDCSVFTLIEINYDVDEAIKIILSIASDNINNKKKRDLTEEFDKIKKLLDPQSDNNEHQTFTTALSSKIQQYKEKVENKQISSEESKIFVNAFKKLVSSLKNDYGKKGKLDSLEISLLDGNEITKLETLYKQAGSIHNKYFDDKIKVLTLPTVNIEANSKYTVDKMYESFASCIELIRYINGDDNSEPKLSINMNYDKIGSGNPDMETQISSMMVDLRNLKIDETLKDQLKQNFKTLLNTANELEKIYDEANKQNFKNGNTEKYESNSSMIYKYKDALVEAISVNYGNDSEMKKMVEKHKTKVKGVDKLNIKSDSNFNLDHAVKNIGEDNMESFIINNPNSKMYLEPYIDALKTEIVNEIRTNEQNNDSPKSISPEALNRLHSLKQNIESRINEVNKYESFEGHYDEVIHLVNVMNGFNEAYDTFIKYSDMDYEGELGEKVKDLKGIYAENYGLESKLEYTRLELQYQIIDDFIKENPELFKNYEGYDSFKEYIDKERATSIDGNKEVFENKEIFHFTADDINNLMGGSNANKNNLKSVSDVMKMISERTTDKKQLMNIQSSSELTKSLIQHSPSFMRNEDQINEMLNTQVLDKNSLNSNRMNLIESDNQIYNRYTREMNANYQKLWLKKMIKDKDIKSESLIFFDTVEEAYEYVLKRYGPDYEKMGIEIFELDMEEKTFNELKNNPKEFIDNIDDTDESKQMSKITKAFNNHNENELRVNLDRLGEEAHNTLYDRFVNNLDYDELNKNENTKNKYNRILSKINKIYNMKKNESTYKFGDSLKHNIGGTRNKNKNIEKLGENFKNKGVSSSGTGRGSGSGSGSGKVIHH